MEVGDRFQFLDETGGGLILEINKGLVLVHADDGREMWIEQHQIIPEFRELTAEYVHAPDPVEPSIDWAIGSKVSYLNEAGGGEIIAEGDQGYLILDEDGFERWFQKSALVLISSSVAKGLSEGEMVNKDETVKVFNPRPKQQSAILEVDLHIHELLEFDSHLSDHEKLEHQLRVAKHQVEKARKGPYKKLILIHGVGKGVLKEQIWEMLRGMDKIEFYEASFQKYGMGATEVVFR